LLHRVTRTGTTLALLEEAREDARVARVGVSLYDPTDLEWLLANDALLELVQLPLSVFDQRFLPWLSELSSREVAVHVRSVFLQGLYFLPDDELTGQLVKARESLAKLRSLAFEAGLELPSLLLAFVTQQSGIERVVVGVETLAQLQDNVAALAIGPTSAGLMPALSGLALDDERVLLPSNWNR